MKSSAWVLSILSLSAAVNGAELKVDHVTYAGLKLAPMVEALERIGIHCEYGGPHTNHATEMAIASFADGSYLELIAFQPKADPDAAAKHPWSKYIRESAGPCAWAVQWNKDMTGARPEKSGRIRPDGFQLAWETGDLDGNRHGVFIPFLIRDITPHDKRAFPKGRPDNPDLIGISKVIIAVRDVAAATERYRKTFHLPAPRRQANRSWFENTPVVLVQDASRGEGVSALVIKTSKAVVSDTDWYGKKIQWIDPGRIALEER